MAALPYSQFYDILTDNEVTHLHHANSVATACLFLRKKSLLSRGTVERHGLAQTPQKSDKQDRTYSIWFDVFVDTADIHYRARQLNKYGPVTFVINVDLIMKTTTGKIWLTKTNPIYWAGKSEKARWFQDIEEMETGFSYGTFGQMVVFRHCGGELPFGRFLEKIILDDPKLKNEKNDVNLYSMAYGALRAAMAESGLNVPIERRVCRYGCTCKTKYKEDSDYSLQMFDPLIE